MTAISVEFHNDPRIYDMDPVTFYHISDKYPEKIMRFSFDQDTRNINYTTKLSFALENLDEKRPNEERKQYGVKDVHLNFTFDSRQVYFERITKDDHDFLTTGKFNTTLKVIIRNGSEGGDVYEMLRVFDFNKIALSRHGVSIKILENNIRKPQRLGLKIRLGNYFSTSNDFIYDLEIKNHIYGESYEMILKTPIGPFIALI